MNWLEKLYWGRMWKIKVLEKELRIKYEKAYSNLTISPLYKKILEEDE